MLGSETFFFFWEVSPCQWWICDRRFEIVHGSFYPWRRAISFAQQYQATKTYKFLKNEDLYVTAVNASNVACWYSHAWNDCRTVLRRNATWSSVRGAMWVWETDTQTSPNRSSPFPQSLSVLLFCSAIQRYLSSNEVECGLLWREEKKITKFITLGDRNEGSLSDNELEDDI